MLDYCAYLDASTVIDLENAKYSGLKPDYLQQKINEIMPFSQGNAEDEKTVKKRADDVANWLDEQD